MIFSILTIVISLLSSCNNSGQTIFTDETYQDTLKQKIGGVLIRKIHYSNDIHSWVNDINYSYHNGFDSINIGSGTYYGEQPPKDEQLVRWGKWILFKTSGDRDKDLLFVCDYKKKWNRFEISPQIIEQTNLWKEQRIESQLDNWDTVSKIGRIDKNGNVIVFYTYAEKNRIFSFSTEERQITYRINMQTGWPEITSIAKR